MFDDMKLNMKFLLRFVFVSLAIVGLVFTFLQNRHALLYLHTWTLMINILLYVPLFYLSARKLFQNKDYEISYVNLIYFIVVILNLLTLVLGLFFMEEKFWNKEFYTFSNVISIIVLPIYVILEFAFLIEKGIYKLYFVPVSLIIPFVYLLSIIIRIFVVRGNGFIVSIYWNQYYPYVFLNLDNGITPLLFVINLICILLGLASLSVGCYLTKRKTYEIEKDSE